jgi:hypothetical protein
MKLCFPAFLFSLILFSCSSPKKDPPLPYNPAFLSLNFSLIRSAVPLIKNGDIIFRNGNDEVSAAARSMNRKDTSYSHAGILFIEHDSVLVYHSIGGIYNPGNRLRRDPIDSFCNPVENSAFGIYRFNLRAEEYSRLREIVSNYYKQGLKFDMFFNYLSDDEMYCSEFVFKSLNKARNGSMSGYVRLDTIPFGVTIDDIFHHPDCRLVKKFTFSQ